MLIMPRSGGQNQLKNLTIFNSENLVNLNRQKDRQRRRLFMQTDIQAQTDRQTERQTGGKAFRQVGR